MRPSEPDRHTVEGRYVAYIELSGGGRIWLNGEELRLLQEAARTLDMEIEDAIEYFLWEIEAERAFEGA